jgi:hypothetical protein
MRLKSKMVKVDPVRMNDLADMQEPRCVNWITEHLERDPNMHTPPMDKELPALMKDLNDMALPTWK